MSSNEAAPDAQAPGDHPKGAGAWRMAEHWPELVSAVTEQSVESVGLLLRGLELLKQRGRISPAEFQVLAIPAERLKHCSMHAQQIVRFQSGQTRQSHEKIDLAYLVESVLQERRNELTMMGLTVRRKFKPVDVLIDPTLGYSLTQAMLDWSTPRGHRMDLRLDTEGPDDKAQLSMKTHTERTPVASSVYEDNIQWLLLCQLAATDGGIDLERRLLDDGVELVATFKRSIASALIPEDKPATADTSPASTLLKTLTGAYVVVCSDDTPTRLTAIEVVRKLGIAVDGAANATQVLDALGRRDVHLLVLDEQHPPLDMPHLSEALSSRYPLLPVVRIGPPGASSSDRQRPLVASDALTQQLGPSVMFTLSNVM